MTIACSAWELRVSSCMACCSPGRPERPVSASTAVRWITSSPIECIRASSRSASTRTVRPRPPERESWARRPWRAQRAGAGLGDRPAASAPGGVPGGGAISGSATERTATAAGTGTAGAEPTSPISTADHVRDGGDRLGDGLLLVLGGDPCLDRAGRRTAPCRQPAGRADQLAVLARGRRTTMWARTAGIRTCRSSTATTWSTRSPAACHVTMSGTAGAAGALELLLGGAGADQAVQPLDQRGGVQRLLAVGLDRSKDAESASRQARTVSTASRAGPRRAGAAARRRPPSHG